jgi:hypothetical protein
LQVREAVTGQKVLVAEAQGIAAFLTQKGVTYLLSKQK